MTRRAPTPEQVEAILRRAGDGDPAAWPASISTAAGALVKELWTLGDEPAPASRLDLPSAEALGRAAANVDTDEGGLLRLCLRLGRATLEAVEAATPEGRGDGALHRDGDALTDEAAVRALAAYAELHRRRRAAWLSFFSHQIKNPLNTVLNALWLLREHHDAPNAGRFLELAERGARRMERTLGELRDLQTQTLADPPDATLGQPAPPSATTNAHADGPSTKR